MLSLAWLGAGLGATYPLILKAWRSKDVKYQMYCLTEAANNETRILLPGAMATGVTGFFWAAAQDLNFVKTGWLAALVLLFIFFYLVCLPLLGFGLRRAGAAALPAAEKGGGTARARANHHAPPPPRFAGLLVISVPLLAWIAVFKPF